MSRRGGRRRLAPWLLCAILAGAAVRSIAVAGAPVVTQHGHARPARTLSPALVQAPASTSAPIAARPGAGDYCKRRPNFAARLGIGKRAFIGTGLRGYKGLTISEPSGKQGRVRVYQDPSWDDAGYLGPYTYDRHGNIYTAPVPLVSLYDNPPELQNRIYRVDTNSGKLELFLVLPDDYPIHPSNPFGVMGLAYDCDSDSLYVSTIAGSTPDVEHGAIYRVDLGRRAAQRMLADTDVFGLGVYNGPHGKRLYFGLARSSEIRSVALAADGGFRGEPRHEFFLSGLPGGRNEKAKRIRFPAPGRMAITGYAFNYSLKAASRHRHGHYRLRYSKASGTWVARTQGRD